MTRTVVHYTDTVAFGGAEQMLLTLAEQLGTRGWRPLLFYHPTPTVERLAAEAARRGIEVVTLPRRNGRVDATILPAVVRELRGAQAGIFHAHLTWPLRCSLGLAASFFARVPHRVATQQLFAPLRSRRALRHQRAVSMLVDRYVAVSNAMAAELAPTLVSGGKVTVVHNGTDVARFDRPCDRGLRVSLTGGAGRPLVLSLARLERQKGLEVLVAAAEMVPEAIFAVAGEGSERARLEDDVARRGLQDRVRFLGHRTDVPALLAACDVFVLPSLFEGLPVSILEAMAARRPVVATAVRGNDEAVVDSVTGLLVPAGEPAALAAAVGRMIHDPGLASAFGAAGRARVQERFSAQEMASRVERLYDELLEGPRSRRFRAVGASPTSRLATGRGA